jgi:hypothetical protein
MITIFILKTLLHKKISLKRLLQIHRCSRSTIGPELIMCAAWIEAAQPASRGVESGNAATAHGVFLTKHSGGAKSPLVVGRPVATNLGETNNMKRLLALFVLAASLLITGCANTPSAGWVARSPSSGASLSRSTLTRRRWPS